MDQSCERSWIYALSVWGAFDSELWGQIELKKSTLTPFWACPRNRSPPIDVRFPNLTKNAFYHCWDPHWFWAWLTLTFCFIFYFKPVLFVLVCIYWVSPSPVSAPHSSWLRTFTDFTCKQSGSLHGPWTSEVRPSGFSQPSTGRLAPVVGFQCRIALKYNIYEFKMLQNRYLSIYYVSIIDMDFNMSIGNGCGNAIECNIQYIPRNMHTVLLCFALLWLCNRS